VEKDKKEVEMLKKAFLLSFILLVFPFFLKGEEWQMIEPPQSYAYLLQRIQENLPIINFDTEEHRNIYNNELSVTINLALQGDLERVKERINEIHIPQATDWIKRERQKDIVVALLMLELLFTNEAPLCVSSNFPEEIKEGFKNETRKIKITFIHHRDCDRKDNKHFNDCAFQVEAEF